MPAPTTVADYCGLLARTQLLAEPEVRALADKWKAGGGADADLDGFRKSLVAGRHLTEYQAALVARGHSDGFTIGGYVILDRIGKGASAGVYKAVHRSGQVVALKVLPGSKAKNPAALARFQREGRLLTQQDHPNVVRAYQVGQSGSVHFIAMEHLDGESLDEILTRRKKLPAPEACRLVSQALAGLGHLHAKRTVHRDLKPSNLMVVPPPDGRPRGDDTLSATLKILDVGIGRETFEEGSEQTRDMDLTSEGTILGTPDYLAPEQARDARTADVRSDIYSLGCVLFHLITGAPPFRDQNVMGQMVKHATEPIPRLPAGTPPGLQAALDGMTAKNPADRYQTPTEAAAALEPYLPVGAAGAEATKLIPAFRDWLDSEAGSEPLPAEVRAAAEGPPPMKPAAPFKPTKPATGTHPAPSAKAPGGAQAAGSKAVKVPSGLHQAPAPKPAAPEPVEIDVELYAPPPGPAVSPADADDERSLFDLDRRDFVMLGAGAAGVLTAVVLGVGLASLMRPPVAPKSDAK